MSEMGSDTDPLLNLFAADIFPVIANQQKASTLGEARHLQAKAQGESFMFDGSNSCGRTLKREIRLYLVSKSRLHPCIRKR